MKMFLIAAALTAWVCMVLAANGYAQSDFYKGKTITVAQIVGAGGTGDLRRRALFPFLQKYIPGNPTIVSDYMPGGGGRKAANHVYRVAKPDGLTIGGMSSSLVTNAILDTGGVQYDIDKLTYLGSPVSVFHYVFLTRKEAGLSSLEKLRAATGVRIGAQEVGHDIYITGRLFAYLLNLKEPRFVTGYGGPEIDIALERRELDGRANALETLGQRNAEEMKKGLLDLHALVEVPRGNRPDGFASLPEVESFAKSDAERKLLTMYRAFRLVGTPYVLAPGTPKAQVQILQEAFRKALKDPEFHREFKKLSGFEASPLMPEEQDKAIRELPRDREVVELFKKISGADPLPAR
ncbi:MAG: Bug family tripartite tricarboxylate transporter substrate binding protein [Candidatus Binatia bacterium]